MVASRAERQTRLINENPPQLWAVIHEAAIRTMVGGPDVMREQLDRLVEVAALPTVSLQVMPFAHGAHGSMGTAFTIMTLPDPPGGQVVYLEGLWSADFFNRPPQVQAYVQTFERLCSNALDQAGTVAMIEQVRGDA